MRLGREEEAQGEEGLDGKRVDSGRGLRRVHLLSGVSELHVGGMGIEQRIRTAVWSCVLLQPPQAPGAPVLGMSSLGDHMKPCQNPHRQEHCRMNRQGLALNFTNRFLSGSGTGAFCASVLL